MPRAAQAWESATGFAPAVPTGKRSSGEPAPRTGRVACRENNGMDLVDWIGRVPSSREKRPSRERFPPSFRRRSIKLCAQSPAEPAPQRVGCPGREWSDRSRLEQRWEPGTNVLCPPGDRWMEPTARAAGRRGSRPRRPRVSRHRLSGWRRSVDRGNRVLDIKPRKVEATGRRRCREMRRPHGLRQRGDGPRLRSCTTVPRPSASDPTSWIARSNPPPSHGAAPAPQA
jgi:hypothetical protein